MAMNGVTRVLPGDGEHAGNPGDRSALRPNNPDGVIPGDHLAGHYVLHRYESYTCLTQVSTSIRVMPNATFGPWLKKRLISKDLTESEFARLLDRPASMVNRWVRGERIPSTQSCDLIADALGLDLDMVLWQAGHRPPTKELDPEDPRIEIHGLVDRVHWTPGNIKMARRVLRTMLEEEEESQ